MRSSVRRPACAGATTAALALLASLLAPIPAMAATDEPGWLVENRSKTTSGAVILNEGHIDIASLLEGDELVTQVKDTSLTSEPVWRDPAQTVIQVLPGARATVPTAAQYGFLGTPGADTWILGHSQRDGLLWPGWSTEGIPAAATQTGFDWTMTDASGPGEFALYADSSSVLGSVDVIFDTRDGITDADSFAIPQATHAHGSWAFSAEGTYCLAFSRSTTLASGADLTTDFVLTVAVGAVDVAAVKPAGCFPAGHGPVEPTTPVTTPTAEPDPSATPEPSATPAPSATPTATPTPTPIATPQPTATPTPAPTAPPATPFVWDVPNGSATRSGAVILNDGHVDIASRITDGALVTRVKDTTSSTTVFRELPDTTASSDAIYHDVERTVFQLKPGTRQAVPESPAFAFLGQPGSTLWQASQTQQDGVLWPGWSTELIDVDATKGGVSWALTDASGPGEFALYESSATVLGSVDVIFNTRDGITAEDSYVIPKNTHAHGTWAFSAEGVYCLAFNRSAELASGAPVSDDFVVAVAVGRVAVTTIDPASCFMAPVGEPAEADSGSIADNLLTPDVAGDLSILAAENDFAAGQLIGVRLGADRAGEWVSAWLHSTPEWLGWQQVDTNGLALVRLPTAATVGEHKLVVKAQDGSLIGWAALRIVAPPVPGGGAVGGPPPAEAISTPPSQSVAATQCVAGATILSSGHIDYASRIVGGKLESLIKDGTTQSTVWREPSGVVMWLKPSSRISLPGGYSAVGAAGSTVWQIPQTQNSNLAWLGWNTESINAGQAVSPVAWTLNSVRGPGTVNVYLQGAFGGVQSIVFGNGGSHSIDLGKHVHGNWAFSAEGIYKLNFTQSITLTNGTVSSDTETLTIAVGDVDPATAISGASGCGVVSNASLLTADIEAADAEAAAAAAAVAAAQAEADALAAAAEAAKAELPGMSTVQGDTDSPFAALTNGHPVPLLLLGLGLILVLGSAVGMVLWRRQQRWIAVAAASPSTTTTGVE